MKNIISDSVFYHVYALGLSGAKERNDFSSPKGSFFEKYEGELENIRNLGANALLIGPVFESTSHGYDTVSYFHIDRRLGDNGSFAHFCKKAHEMGFKIILDAVFNHTGRDFFAFKDIQKNGWNSSFKDWYKNLDFSKRSPYNDNFDYEGWAGCKDLVKLNVENPEVKNHLFDAVKMWINDFEIDGLRLDAADVLSLDFLRELSDFTKSIKNDFWLMGEVVRGDYNNWIRNGKIDSVTNYEAYKGLWSSFNSENMFEIAYSLNREFGEGGLYKDSALYNFVDNHDVNRLASTLTKKENLFAIYGLLFTMPGVPSIYYGSEFGIKGRRNNNGDKELRPSLPPFSKIPDFASPNIEGNDLYSAIKKFGEIRKESNALKKGNYRQISVQNKAFAFERDFYEEKYVVCVNASLSSFSLKMNGHLSGKWKDVLNDETFENPYEININSSWLRILKKVA